MEQGGAMPVALNAANEIAVEMFLSEPNQIPEIAEKVDGILQKIEGRKINNIDDVFEMDSEARRRVFELASLRAANGSAAI